MRSIQQKLLLSVLLLVTSIIASMVFFHAKFESELLEQRFAHQLEAEARTIALGTTHALAHGDMDGLHALARQAVQQRRLSHVSVLADDGTATTQLGVSKPLRLPRDPSFGFHRTADQLLFIAPVDGSDPAYRRIAVALPASELHVAESRMKWRYLWASISVAVLGIAGISLMSFRITEPIKKLIAASLDIAQGNYSTRVAIKSRDETGTLAENFNQMAGQIESVIAQLRAMDQLRSDFLTLLAHEVRTPVAIILGMAEMLERGMVENEAEARELAGAIHEAGSRLSRLAENSLELFRWYSGTQFLDVSRVRAADWVERSILQVQVDAGRKQVAISAQVDPEVSFQGDITVLTQALQRVLDNAVKFSRERGLVTISLDTTASDIILRVTDNGAGIPVEKLDHLFKPLVIGGEIAHHTEGQALSLSLIKAAIEAHWGKITIASAGPGRGTIVAIQLPKSLGLSEAELERGHAKCETAEIQLIPA